MSCWRIFPARARRRWPRRSPDPLTRSSSASSSRPICCRRTSSASRFSTSATSSSIFTKGRFSPTSCWPTKSTAPRRARNRRCSKRWAKARSASRANGGICPNCFLSSPRKIPVEFRGTYPLPEAQMDRFAMQFTLGYVQPEEEVAILTAQEHNHPLDELKPVRHAGRRAGAQARRRRCPHQRRIETLRRGPGRGDAHGAAACNSAPARARPSR